MSRKDRAKQFAPFDALKGLQDALRLKEYQHERTIKGDIPEEKIEAISKILLDLDKDEMVEVQYFYDGYYKTLIGKARVDIIEQKLKVNNQIIPFDDIVELNKPDNAKEGFAYNKYMIYKRKIALYLVLLFFLSAFNWSIYLCNFSSCSGFGGGISDLCFSASSQRYSNT